jgi:hypothetical protein
MCYKVCSTFSKYFQKATKESPKKWLVFLPCFSTQNGARLRLVQAIFRLTAEKSSKKSEARREKFI